jgi:hypothetical protein
MHIPVIALAAVVSVKSMGAAQMAGMQLVVSEAAITRHLSEWPDRALHVE